MTGFPIGLHRPVEHPGPPPGRADLVIIGATTPPNGIVYIGATRRPLPRLDRPVVAGFHTGSDMRAEPRVARVWPDLGAVTSRVDWAGVIDTPPDELPVAGRAPIQWLSICTGMNAQGFDIGPGSGRIAADLIAGRGLGHDLIWFRLSRFCDGTRLQIGPHT